MKELGIYYSEQLSTVILGYKVPGKHRDQLAGKVIGHTIKRGDWLWHAYNVGYEYHDWDGSFIYIGRYTTFTTLKGYMDFLIPATTQQIEGYFKSKQVVLEHIHSFLRRKSNQGITWFERIQKPF